jgi:hypothetical protein
MQSTRNWWQQVAAVVTAAFLAMYPGTSARASGPASARAKTAAAPTSPAGSCQINSPRRKISHVVTIIFDNTHFMRDPARDGSTLVP